MSKSKKSKKAKRRIRRHRVAKPRMTEDGRILVMTAEEATLAHKPIYDGWAVRGGIHGDVSYNRRKEKRDFRRLLDDER